jgi:hypothetical protein
MRETDRPLSLQRLTAPASPEPSTVSVRVRAKLSAVYRIPDRYRFPSAVCFRLIRLLAGRRPLRAPSQLKYRERSAIASIGTLSS